MEKVATLLLAHLIADFPLQTNLVYRLKTSSRYGLALHAGIHAAVSMLLVRDSLRLWPYWLALFAAHFAIDWGKLHQKPSNQARGFLVDQGLHFSFLVLLALLMPGFESVLPAAVLYAGVIFALAPVILMYLWIYAQSQPQPAPSARRSWAKERFLAYSHRAGYLLVAGVLIAWLAVVVMQ